jgi:hypothetical protein
VRSSWVIPTIVIGLAATAGAQTPVLVPDAMRAAPQNAPSRQVFTIRSGILGVSRRINVSLPASFSSAPAGRKFPVVVLFDGESLAGPASLVAGELAANGMIPELVIVGIENMGGAKERVFDLTPPGLSVSGSSLNEGGDRLLDFVEMELLPAVDRQFRGTQPRILVGHSSGGILATYAAAARPEYRAVISIDAPVSLGENWLAKRLHARTGKSDPPLRYVSLEARFGWPAGEWKSLTSAAPATWRLHRESLRLEGHETIPFLGIYLGLREVFSDYSRLVAQEKPASAVLEHYATVASSFGAPLLPPRRLLRDVIDDLASEGRGAMARQAYTLFASSYGPPADSVAILADISNAEKQTAPTETVESLLATPFPTPDEARRFIGDWVGSRWMTPDEPRTNSMTLRIRVDSGRVVAEFLNPGAPPDRRVQRADYLRITPVGLTYGMLNGMRPRGVVLWEGTLKGDTLSGKQRWGGVAFAYPPGSNMDPGFRFVRVR